MSARHVAIVVPDLLFATRILETARLSGIETVSMLAAAAHDAVRNHPPDLLIVDLEGPEAITLIRGIKSDPATAGVTVIGFYPHVAREVRSAALAAGADQVLPRSAFTMRLPQVLAGTAG
jgi:CheY-like chemotaxis protein